MFVLPTIKMCENEIIKAIDLCKGYLGKDAVYTAAALEKLKSTYEEIIEVINISSDTIVKVEVTPYGGGKMLVDGPAVRETKAYKETMLIISSIGKILEVLKANKTTKIKGFQFDKKQILVGAEYFFNKYMKIVGR